MSLTKKRQTPSAVESEEEELYPTRSHTTREEDGFNEQPGSGSTIGGLRGEQEYGIEGEIAQEEEHQRAEVVSIDREGSGGLSQFSAGGINTLIAKSEASDELLAAELPESSAELEYLIAERLQSHPVLCAVNIFVHITPTREVLLTGTVHSEAERILALELLEAVAPAMPICNQLKISTAR